MFKDWYEVYFEDVHIDKHIFPNEIRVKKKKKAKSKTTTKNMYLNIDV